jgi:hypothetical protein
MSRIRVFKGAATFPHQLLGRFGRSQRGVMRGFERVVALPDPKDIEFPQPQQSFT